MGESFNTTLSPKRRPRCPALVTRVLAVIGAILLLERTLSYSVYRNYHGAYYYPQQDSQDPSLSQDPGLSQDTGLIQDTGPSQDPDLAQDVGELVTHPSSEPSTPTGQSKAIVVASVRKSNTSWVREHFPDWNLNIYIADDRNADLTVMKNEGRESTVYLTYIINHYYDLPEYVVFLHERRYQWHNDDPMYDGVNPVKLLRLQRVDEEGYVSLRCAWFPGCPVGAQPNLTVKEDQFGTRKDFARAYQLFFPNQPLPSKVGAPCCSQFAVSREQIRKRPVQDYEMFRHWLWTTKIGGPKSGRVLEYMWHMIFGKPIIHCPNAPECYCKTFGLCHLKCPDNKKCRGRWIMPPWNAKMPEKWPHEGLGQGGFPSDKWWESWYPPSEWDGWEPRKKAAKPEIGAAKP